MKRKILSILFAVVLVAGLCLVTAVPAAAADINVPGDYTTIQAAIDAASDSDTIIVGDGTYTEDLTISGLTNLTIRSVNGSASTIIQLVDGVGIDIQGTAGGFTLGGTAGQGFTILSGAATTFNIQLANAPSNVTISHNTIDTIGNATMGVSVGAAGATGLTISDNTFTAETGDGCIWGPNVVTVTVSDNIISGGSYAVQFSGVTGTSTISNNTISASAGSGAIVISNGAGTSGLVISGNNISSCMRGIRFAEYCAQGTAADMTTVTVTENTLTANNIGLLVGDGTHVLASNFTIDNNNFSGNNVALDNDHSTEVVTAADNWWGHASGPAYPPEHPGLGDPISDNVVYCPWLDAPYPTGIQAGRVTNVTTATEYCTIQAALDAASDGDTIIAGDGTYTEDLTVNTPNITLRSENGRDVTTIQLVTGVGIDIQGGADNFTLGGAAGQGFKVKSNGGASTTFAIQLANAPSGVTISYNEIDTTGNASMGISIGAAGATGLTISNNTFIADSSGPDGAIWGPEVVDVTVSGNTFTAASNPGYAIQFSGVTGTSTISGNTITDYGNGILISNGQATSDLTISGNTVTECTNAIRFADYAAQGPPGMMEDVTVSGNTLTDNNIGVRVGAGAHIDTSGFVIDGNTIRDNSYGIKFEGGAGGTISNNLICQNGSFGAGIWLEELVSEVVIIGNCIVNNYHGIYVKGCYNIIGRQGEGNVIGGNNGYDSGVHLTTTAFGNVINYNDIAFNFDPSSGGFGVFNENPVPVDATNNWWGHVDGPSLGFIPFVELPAGDTISQYVAYEPWLTSPAVDTTAPIITYAAASPSMVSIWSDDMFQYMWGCNTNYSVGPSCFTMFSVKASDDLCGIAKVTINKRALLFDMIPEEKLQKFIDQLDPSGLAAWEDYLAYLEDIEMSNEVLEYGCWTEGECLCAVLAITLMEILDVNPIELAEIMGQELKLGKFDIEVTAYDYSGNSDTTDIAITIVDFQMPVCEGWNLRSTWLDLENNKWQDIVAMDDGLDADSILRWNNELQRWEQYMEVDDVGYWYYGVTQVAPALMQTLESYWIHGLYNDQFGLITFRGVSAPPSRQLYAGWNLIGTALAWHQPGLRVDDALISIYEGEEHCTGYTQVLSIDQLNWWAEEYYICGTYPYEYPCEGDYCWCDGLPNNNGNGPGYYKCFWQDTWVYTRRGNPDGPPPPPPVTRGGGYWVFQQNPAVLAGFNSTPLPVEFWFQWLECGD